MAVQTSSILETPGTNEVADALEELLHDDPSDNTDVEPPEDLDRTTHPEDLSRVLTKDNPEDRFIKKRWKKWKKKAEKKWKKAKRAAEKKYRRAKKAAEKKWRGIRKMRDWRRLRRITWRKASKAWRRMRREARRSGNWMRKNLSKRKLREISRKVRRAARRNRRWFVERTKFLPKPVRWMARRWYKFSSYSIDGLSIQWRIWNQFKDGVNIYVNWWNPCGWYSMYR